MESPRSRTGSGARKLLDPAAVDPWLWCLVPACSLCDRPICRLGMSSFCLLPLLLAWFPFGFSSPCSVGCAPTLLLPPICLFLSCPRGNVLSLSWPRGNVFSLSWLRGNAFSLSWDRGNVFSLSGARGNVFSLSWPRGNVLSLSWPCGNVFSLSWPRGNVFSLSWLRGNVFSLSCVPALSLASCCKLS